MDLNMFSKKALVTAENVFENCRYEKLVRKLYYFTNTA